MQIDKPRCYNHRHTPVFPEGCATCGRIRLEQTIVTKVVDTLLTEGYALQVNDGESYRPEQLTRDRAEILRELMETDDDCLVAVWVGPSIPEGPLALVNHPAKGWVRFVYGNDGWDVINDYTTAIDGLLKPVNDYCDQMGGVQ